MVAAAMVAATMVAATVQAAAMVVQPSPSPQQSTHLPGEAIKKESQPSSLSETLDPNLGPSMVLCNTVKSVKEESRVYSKCLFTKIRVSEGEHGREHARAKSVRKA